jgi:pimeloyl-ACP methyl ester carboxylesterase
MPTLNTVQTKVLEITFLDEGPVAGWPVILVHGFPYDVHVFDEVVPRLAQAGARVIVPYLRGFGPTRFLAVGNRLRLVMTLSISLMLSAFKARSWPATIGVAWRPVWLPLCGRTA